MIRRNSFVLSLLLGGLIAAPIAAQEPGTDAALEAVLAGEFALQAGHYEEAARRYAQAAGQSADPALAERAAQIALATRQLEAAAEALLRWRQLAPDDPEPLAAMLMLGLSQADAQASREALERLLQADPTQGWQRALQAFAAAGSSSVLPGLLRELIAAQTLPDDLQLWLALAGLAQRHGELAVSGELVAAAVVRFPDDPRTWLLQAGQLREQGDAAGARAAVEQALAHAGVDLGLRLGAAGELERLGDPAAAAAALEGGPQNEHTWAARAAYLAQAEDQAGLAALHDELRREATDERGRARHGLLLGQLAEYLERHDEALAWYRGVGGDARHRAQLRSAVVLEKAGREGEAVRLLRELQHSDEADGELVLDSYLLEADLHTRQGRHGHAVAALGRGLDIFEEDPRLLYGRALARERLDDIAGAEADLRLILAEDPENVAALNALGYTLADRTERYEEAYGYIERAYAQDPDNPAIIDSMGWVLYRLGRKEEALEYLNRAFDLYEDAEVAAHLGEVLWALGRHDDARAVWEQGKAIDPDSRPLRETLERLQP